MPLVQGHEPLDGFIPNPEAPSGYQRGQILASDNAEILENPHIRRPYKPTRGPNVDIPCVTVHTGRYTVEKGEKRPIREQRRIIDLMNEGFFDPVFFFANQSSLRKEEWEMLDAEVQAEYLKPMTAWLDLMGISELSGFDGMGVMTVEYEAMSDVGEAVVDMTGDGQGVADAPLYNLRSTPLPVTHMDWYFTKRRLMVSKNKGTPLDFTMGGRAARVIGEKIERTTIGVDSGITYGTQTAGPGAHTGTSTVYGLINHPERETKSDFLSPLDGAWTPEKFYNSILAALQQMYALGVYGPFSLYYSFDWDQYINRPFSVAGGNNASETLRSMLLKIPDIAVCKRLNFLTGSYRIVLVNRSKETARAINGQDIITVQWPSLGGMKLNYKTMVIQAPQIKSTFSGVTGVLDGTTA